MLSTDEVRTLLTNAHQIKLHHALTYTCQRISAAITVSPTANKSLSPTHMQPQHVASIIHCIRSFNQNFVTAIKHHVSKRAPEASQGRAGAPAHWWANLSQTTAAPLPASYLSFSGDLQNTFEEQKFITTLDTKNYRINPIWHYTEHTISNPPCLSKWLLLACPAVLQGNDPTTSSFADTLLCSSGVSLAFISNNLRKWVIQGNSSKPLPTFKFVSISSLKAGFCAWTLVCFCHLNDLIYRPVLSHLFTMVKTSLIFAVSLYPVLCFPQYPCKYIQRVFIYTT